MALQKDFELDNGVTGNYLRVENVLIENKNGANDSFYVYLYLNKSASDNGKKPLKLLFTFNFPFDKGEVLHNSPFTLEAMNTVDNNPYKIAYNWLKTQPEFSGAIDV